MSSRLSLLLSLLLASMIGSAVALFEDEVGVSDFLVATAGHSVNRYVSVATNHGSIITSDSPSSAGFLYGNGGDSNDNTGSSCFVASRTIASGDLLWRRNVCATTTDSTNRHVVSMNEDDPNQKDDSRSSMLYTLDQTGLVRAWTKQQGGIVWETSISQQSHQRPTTSTTTSTMPMPRLWSTKHTVAATINNAVLFVYDAKSGKPLSKDPLLAAHALKYANIKASSSSQPVWLHWMPMSNENETEEDTMVQALVGFVSAGKDGPATTGDTMALVQLRIQATSGTVSIESSKALKYTDSKFLHHTLGIQTLGPQNEQTHTLLEQSRNHWEDVVTADNNVAYCPDMNDLVVTFDGTSVLAFHVDKDSKSTTPSALIPVQMTGNITLVKDHANDEVLSLTVLNCQQDSTTILITTLSGSTLQVTLAPSATGGGVSSTLIWTAEEGLSQVSSALLLDASHASPSITVDALTQEEEEQALSQLHWSSRFYAQWDALLSLGSGSRTNDREHVFGFSKVAVLLSQASHKIWGMDTSGEHRSSIRWSITLPPQAKWHTIVHGTASGNTAVHGNLGASHSREVLLLSALTDSMDWTCMDGTNGQIHASGSTETHSPVVQVIPLFATATSPLTSSCRQMAVLVHKDHSVSVLPGDGHGLAAAELAAAMGQNGLYAHVFDRKQRTLQSLQIVPTADKNSVSARLVGQTAFPGERIVRVTYPQRDEAVQSPCSVSGDDSLLLKYLNPHLAVVVTMSDDKEDGDEEDDFFTVLDPTGGNGADGAKRKPLGVTPTVPGGDAPETSVDKKGDVPNLFINVIDTVSGRVLHRVSHANASPANDVPALINENWIMYAFFNNKTRRTELGVLSLYEGMIDKQGLTAFSSPEQATSFSSLDSRSSKPVVLAKTYGLQKPITAVGVTSSRGGIATRQILMASGDDKIMTIDRRLLEPRRPTGDLKESEKKEGLQRYSPLVPLISLLSPSYNQTVHSVRSIISTSTALESQSLVLAFGGPDIFFTRMAPSKGFDLLPDSFNRPLLSLVVLSLLVLLGVVRNMSSKKMVKMGWS